MTETRGIRNNNPGNIRKSADPWQGLDAQQTDPAFFKFSSPLYGIRALARILINYQDKYNLNTITGIIGRWAPGTENDTAAYVADVCSRADLTADQELNMHDYNNLCPLVKAIIWHENGQQPYTDAQIDKALVLAGVEPPTKSMQQSRTVRGSQVAAGAGAAATIAGTIAQVQPAIPVLRFIHDNLNTLSFGLILVGLAVLSGVAYVVYARLDDRRKGLR